MPTFPKGHAAWKTTLHNGKIVENIPYVYTRSTRQDLSESIPRDRLIIRLLARDGDRCYLCHAPQPPLDYEIDHIAPQAHGGTDHFLNLALACKSCNSRKRDRIISIRVSDRMPCYSLPR